MDEKRPALVILTGAEDATASFMESRLIERSIPYCRIDTDCLIEDLGLNVDPQSADRSSIVWRNLTLSLDSVLAVWYRRPVQPRTPKGFSEREAALASREMLSALWGTLLCHPGRSRWFSPPDAIAMADYKPEQLARASALGFRIPATLVTSCNKRAQEFIRRHDSTVAKPVHEGYVELEGRKSVTWTSLVTGEDVANTSVSPIPMIFQQAIHPKVDVRATVVDDRVWAAAISYEASDRPSSLDWRASSSVAQSHEAELDEDTLMRILALVRSYGLRFAAVDLARCQEDGAIYFLELNAVGQWGWLEIEAGLPLRDALLDAFMGA